MKILLVLLLTLVLHEVVLGAESREKDDLQMSDDARLYKHLTEEYNKWNPDRATIPVRNTSHTIKVDFALAVRYFLNFDAETHIGEFHSTERYVWIDTFLKWNPEKFGGIDQIRIPITNIWKPDIVLYNGVDPNPVYREVSAVVSSDGTVLYVPPAHRKVVCYEDDYLTCEFKFGSWTYDGFRVDIDFCYGLEEADIKRYQNNTHYHLVSRQAKKNVKYYPCCKEPYPDLTFKLQFRSIATSGHMTTVLGVILAIVLCACLSATVVYFLWRRRHGQNVYRNTRDCEQTDATRPLHVEYNVQPGHMEEDN